MKYIYIYIYFLYNAPIFEHEQNGICGILEKKKFSFCIRERVVIKF